MGKLSFIAVALIAAAATASAQFVEPVNPYLSDVNAPAFARTEHGCLGGRVLDYLDRHGDYGVIDAEALLYVTRLEHDERRFDALNRRSAPNAIDGSVWQSIGPINGAGRTVGIALHPTIPGTAIVGAAGGGAWKTTNSGESWVPLTDTIPNLSVGAVTYAPSDPNRVYLGTGEGGYAGDFIPGIGLLRSNDGGVTWNLPASVLATMFYRILVHPANADDLIVGTNEGALRSADGGTTWTTVIAPRLGAGITTAYGDVADIVRDPSNPAVLYAATWDRMRWCAARSCDFLNLFASPTVLKSIDSGATWTPAATGLPVSTMTVYVERMSLAIAPSSPNILYAMLATKDETGVTLSRVYKTTDGGGSWSETAMSSSSSRNLMGTQGWYDNTIVVHPIDANVVIAGGIGYARTADGGQTWSQVLANGVHVDAHDLRYDSTGTLWIANDGGVWTSLDGVSGTSRNAGLVTRQYYAMSQDTVHRDRILGGTQDNGTNMRRDGATTSWVTFTGGDGFQCLINPDVSSVAYSTYQYAEVLRTNGASTTTPSITRFTPRYAADETKPFFSILKPDPNASSTLYTATTRVWKSTTAGDAWIPLPTTVTGGSTWTAGTVRALAVARTNPDVIVISKGNALYRTANGGTTWARINLGLPGGRTITNIEIDPADENRLFVTLAGIGGPSVYTSSNAGLTWSSSAEGLPSFSALVIRFDPTDSAVMYAGTDVGVYRSTNNGAHWSRFGTGLPAVSVYDIQMFSDGSAMRAATHGRGMWELAIAPSSNTPPTAKITSPLPVRVQRGASVTFTGEVSDAAGDAVSAKWTFPDDWSVQSVPAGKSTVAHRFARAGRWPVTLTATDSRGAKGAAELMVDVTERGDDCATPIVVPPAGVFPWSISLNTESGTRQTLTDTRVGGSCYPFTAAQTFWLSFTPAVSGLYTFSLCSSRVAGYIAMYSGDSCGPYTEGPMCSTNRTLGGDCAKDPFGSVQLEAGTTYRFQVGPYFLNNYGEMTVTIGRGSVSPVTLRSVSPATGPAGGGTLVTIVGTEFDAASKVRFGGVLATDVNVIGTTLITARTPANASAGAVDVTVESAAGTITSAGAFDYEKLSSRKRRRSARH